MIEAGERRKSSGGFDAATVAEGVVPRSA